MNATTPANTAELVAALEAGTSEVRAPFLLGTRPERLADRVKVPSNVERALCWPGQVVTVHAVHPVFGGVRVECTDAEGQRCEFIAGRDVFVTVVR